MRRIFYRVRALSLVFVSLAGVYLIRPAVLSCFRGGLYGPLNVLSMLDMSVVVLVYRREPTAETARVCHADLLCLHATASCHMCSISLGWPSCWAQDDRGRPLGLFQPEAGARPPLELMAMPRAFFSWDVVS